MVPEQRPEKPHADHDREYIRRHVSRLGDRIVDIPVVEHPGLLIPLFGSYLVLPPLKIRGDAAGRESGTVKLISRAYQVRDERAARSPSGS
jgi:hypothetical protein